jgi:hypothetical protein
MKTQYSYAILRYAHDTLAGELVNVGVALYAPNASFAAARLIVSTRRVARLFPGIDGKGLARMLRLAERRLNDVGESLFEGLKLLDAPKGINEYVSAVLPPDDSSLQWSEPGGGLTENPSVTLDQLFKRLVARYDEVNHHERRTDQEIWKAFRPEFESRHIWNHLRPHMITVQDDSVEFSHAWKNEQWHCIQPVSFDLTSADGIREKAHIWLGRMASIKDAREKFMVYLLLGAPQDAALRGAYERAVSILRKAPGENRLVPENEAGAFADEIAGKIVSHSMEK